MYDFTKLPERSGDETGRRGVPAGGSTKEAIGKWRKNGANAALRRVARMIADGDLSLLAAPLYSWSIWSATPSGRHAPQVSTPGSSAPPRLEFRARAASLAMGCRSCTSASHRAAAWARRTSATAADAADLAQRR